MELCVLRLFSLCAPQVLQCLDEAIPRLELLPVTASRALSHSVSGLGSTVRKLMASIQEREQKTNSQQQLQHEVRSCKKISGV